MRILVHDYAGHPFQVQLSRALARNGHQVLHAFGGSLETPRGELTRKPDDPGTLEISEVPMDPDYPRHKYNFIKRRRMEIDYGRETAKLVRDWKPDAVISANTPTDSQGSILRATHQQYGRFIYWVQDVYSVAIEKLLRKKMPLLGFGVSGYYRALDKSHLQRSDHIVAIADDFRPLLTDAFKIDAGRISVIPNWAPLESLPSLARNNAWSTQHGLDDKFCFLYSGTLGMKHNPALLLELARRFQDRPEVRVLVISEGIGSRWLAEEQKRLGLENLLLLPYQPFSRLPEVLASADVLLGVLEKEAGAFSVPSKVLTYLCAKRPLLLAVPPENLAARTVRKADAGLTVPPDDVESFLGGAETLYENPGLRAIKAKNSRKFAENTFKIADIAVTFENILNYQTHSSDCGNRNRSRPRGRRGATPRLPVVSARPPV